MAGQSDRVTRAIDRLNTKINLELTEAEATALIAALDPEVGIITKAQVALGARVAARIRAQL